MKRVSGRGLSAPGLLDSVLVSKPRKYIPNFSEFLGALRALGAKRRGDYTYEVVVGQLFALDPAKVEQSVRLLESVGAVGWESLKAAAERVAGLRERYKVVAEVRDQDAYVFVAGDAQRSVRELLTRDWREGGFRRTFRVYDAKLRRYVERVVDYFRPLAEGAALVVRRGHLPRLAALLDSAGIPHNIWEIRFPVHVDESLVTVPLRDYQVRAVRAALDRISRFGAATIMAATGSGKTEMGIAVVQAAAPTPERPALIVVPTRDLVIQWVERLRSYGLDPAYVTGDSHHLPDGWRIMVTTYHTPYSVARLTSAGGETEELAGEEEEEEVEQEGESRVPEAREAVARALRTAGLVVFDEVHHLPARTVLAVADANPGAARLGLSATPWRNDGRDMVIYGSAGEVADRVTSSELIEKGFLVPAAIFALRTGLAAEGSTYAEVKRGLLTSEARLSLACDVVRLLPKPVLVLAQERSVAERLYERLRERGVRALLLTGEQGTEERAAALEAVRRGEVDALVATTVADEGLDLPNLASLLLYFPGKSRTRVYQRIGRALRPHEGKPVAVVVDMVDDARFFREHAEARLEMYRAEPKWVVREVGSLSELEAALAEVMGAYASDVRRRLEALRERVSRLESAGWRREQGKLTVIPPDAEAAPVLRPPVYAKAWRFGPYTVYAYRAAENDDHVWILKRRRVAA